MSQPTLKVINPFDHSVVCELDYDSDEHVDAALAAAQLAFRTWSRAPLDERLAHVSQALDRVQGRREEIAREVTLQMGKPLDQARAEVDTLIDRGRQSLAEAPLALADDVLPEKKGFCRRIVHAPLGVVFNIAAWNYPLVIPINVIIPALLAGNAVVLKHSRRTPLTGRSLAAAFDHPDLPGLISNVVVSHERTARLIGDVRVAHVCFTGSVEGGRTVYQQAARRLIDVGLELGGKDPAYVAEDADLDFAVENIVDGACYNAGQSCCAIERVYVHRTLYEPFIERAAELMMRYRMGDPLDEATTLGPLADHRAPEQLQRQVDDALQRGARLVLDGPSLPNSGNFFAPTLIADAPQAALVMREESFGPLLPVAAVAGDDEALQRMNDSTLGLTASVWTRDADRAERLAGNIAAGTVYQNRADYLDPMLPWTGWGDSGIGSTLSRYGFHGLTRRKSLHLRL